MTYLDLLSQNIIIPVIIQNNQIHSLKNQSKLDHYIKGAPLFYFKGKSIKLDIVEDEVDSNPKILNNKIINSILYSLITTINYIYGREAETFGISTPTREVHPSNS